MSSPAVNLKAFHGISTLDLKRTNAPRGGTAPVIMRKDGPALISPRARKAVAVGNIISPRARRLGESPKTGGTKRVAGSRKGSTSSQSMTHAPPRGPSTSIPRGATTSRTSYGSSASRGFSLSIPKGASGLPWASSAASLPRAGSTSLPRGYSSSLPRGPGPAVVTSPKARKRPTQSFRTTSSQPPQCLSPTSSPSLSHTFKSPSRSMSPMIRPTAADPIEPLDRSASTSPVGHGHRGFSWSSVRPSDITTKQQWESLISNDMEVAGEITDQCGRIADAAAGVEMIADQIRELESRQSENYYSAASETNNNYYTPPPDMDRSPSPYESTEEFGSVTSLLVRSQRVSTITERREQLVRELLEEDPVAIEDLIKQPAGTSCLAALSIGAEDSEETKRERREQLIRELRQANPPCRHARTEITAVTTELSTLSTEVKKSWAPNKRHFSKPYDDK